LKSFALFTPSESLPQKTILYAASGLPAKCSVLKCIARLSFLLCSLMTFSAGAIPDLRIEVTTFGCDCLATNSFSTDHFNALNVPSLNGKFLALTTDNRRLQIAAKGNVLAIYHNDLNSGWSTNTPAQSAADFNQYALNNHTSTGPRPDWIAMNEISSSQWQNDADYRAWLIETMRLLRETYRFNIVLYAPFSNPGANSTSWRALSNYVYIGVENYLSGEEIKAQNFSESWCQSRYQSSVNSYVSVGMPRDKLVLTEHFAHTLTGTGWGRAGISSNEWDLAVAARSRAARNVGFAGYSSYAWVYNHMLVSKEEMIHFEQTYVTNPLPTLSGITAPYISLGPQNKSVHLGDTATFVVYQAGTNQMAFQWRLNGVPIPGATSSSLVISDAEEGDEGFYTAVLGNPVGVATSLSAFLSVHSVFDPFGHPAGSALVGQATPDGLVWTAAGPSGAAITVANESLAVPGATGRSILFGNATGPSARVPIGRTISNGTLYFSFAFRVLDLGGLNSTGGFFAAFNNSIGTQSTTPTSIGAGVQVRASGSGFEVGLKKASGGSVFDGSKVYSTNDIIFVVGSYTINTGSTEDDEAKLWINPDPNTFGAVNPPPPTLFSSSGSDIPVNSIASFVFFRRGTSNASLQPASMMADELRIADTWGGVAPPLSEVDFPLLQTRRSGNNLVVSWPTNSTGFTLEILSTLTNGSWQPAAGTLGYNGPYFAFTNQSANPSAFFRLRK
jgi:hypothetical protein